MLKKDYFFNQMKELGLALTFDDVRLKTGYSEVMPSKVLLDTKFSKNISLKIPIASSAMDTVTESKMAIAMAKCGGIGIIHRNMDPEKQASEVSKVKYHLNGLIEKPITIEEDEKIEDVLKKIEEKQYGFHSLPVVDKNNKIVGIITKNDFDLSDNLSASAKNIMSTKLIIAPAGTTIDQAYEIMKKEKKKVLPLINENMEITGMYVFSDVKRLLESTSPMYNIDSRGQLIVGAAVGTGEVEKIRIQKLVSKNVDVLVIDTAHADSKPVFEMIRYIKENFSVDVVIGNVSEPESVKRLIEAGADGIKIGQGPGSICTTRIIAGIGKPQVTAIYECSKIAAEYKIPICADGGIRYSGDITIAIGAGASSVMLGNLLSGTKESPGDIIFKNGRQWKLYRGMGSLSALKENESSRQRYRQDDQLFFKKEDKSLISEGVEGLVPYKGEVKEVIVQYIGGLKNGMGYIGAATIKELNEKADFIRISDAGKKESHPHDINIVNEQPNYQSEF